MNRLADERYEDEPVLARYRFTASLAVEFEAVGWADAESRAGHLAGWLAEAAPAALEEWYAATIVGVEEGPVTPL